MGLEWRDVAAFLAAAGMMGGVLVAYMKFRLSGDFAKASDVTALGSEIAALKTQIGQMPTHSDVRFLDQRIAQVERGVAVVQAKIEGVADLLRGIEKTSDLLLRHQLEQDRGVE